MNPRQIVIKPVISEKSYALVEQNKYTFVVHMNAHKTAIRQAVEALFDVKVVDVRTIKVRPKPKRRNWSVGRTRAWKKAIVQLAAGERIQLFEGAGT